MQILRLIFVRTGTYNDMTLRPYQSTVSPQNIMALQEATDGGRNMQATALAGVAGSILRPVAQSQGLVTVPNGWETPRLRFILEIQHQDFAGGQRLQYLTGYTDHIGLSHAGSLDPQLRLYINNSISTNTISYATPTGRVSQQQITDASQVLQGSYTPSFSNVAQTAHLMRPMDMFKSISAQSVMGDVTDLRSTFAGENLKMSRRTNSAPIYYLSRVMQAHQAVVSDSDSDAEYGAMMNRAAGMVKETLVASDPFFAQAKRQTSLSEGTSLTFGELCDMYPEARHPSITMVLNGSEVSNVANHQRGSTAYWNGNDNETVFATILSHSVPAIMMDTMLMKVGFLATNQTIGGHFEIKIGGANSFARGLNLDPYVHSFVTRLQTEILADLVQNARIPVRIQAEFDLLGETKLTIGVGSNPLTTFTTPSFCDALFAPVLTNNSVTLSTLTHDVGSIFDNLHVSYAPQKSSPSFAPQELFRHGSPNSV